MLNGVSENGVADGPFANEIDGSTEDGFERFLEIEVLVESVRRRGATENDQEVYIALF